MPRNFLLASGILHSDRAGGHSIKYGISQTLSKGAWFQSPRAHLTRLRLSLALDDSLHIRLLRTFRRRPSPAEPQVAYPNVSGLLQICRRGASTFGHRYSGRRAQNFRRARDTGAQWASSAKLRFIESRKKDLRRSPIPTYGEGRPAGSVHPLSL